ncbi:MAG: MFS transporter [Chloroflexi bacterium]|nr:MFS transporter [Chloroflexota bacterium]
MDSSTRTSSAAAVATEERRRFNLTTFSSLQYRDFRFLWSSTFFTAAGNWVQQITIGWLVYEMTGSALLTGLVSGLRAVPFLFVGPLAGVLADRLNRKYFLIATEVFLSALGLGFAILLTTDYLQVWHILAFSILSGLGWSITNPLRNVMVPNVVPRHALMNAVALNSAAFNLTRIAGPAVGGILIAAFGPATNFFIQAISYFMVSVLVWFIRSPMKAQPAAGGNGGGHGGSQGNRMFKDLAEGIRYVAHEPTTLALIIVGLIPSIFMMPFTQSMMPVFTKDVLHVDSRGLGLIMASAGAGAFIGTMAVASLSQIKRKGLLLIAAASIAAVTLMVYSQVTWIVIAVPVIAIQGGFQMVYNTTNNTVLQIITPDEYRGRVMSLYMLDHGFTPAGAFLAGALAQAFGAPTAFLFGGIVTLVLVLLLATRAKKLKSFTG